MDNSDNEYYEEEEILAEGGVLVAAVEIENPDNLPENPESPSPKPSSPVASPGPAFPVDPLGYNSEEEAFGGAELQIFSSGGVARLQERAEFVRSVCGQVRFLWVVPLHLGTNRDFSAGNEWAPVGGGSFVSGRGNGVRGAPGCFGGLS